MDEDPRTISIEDPTASVPRTDAWRIKLEQRNRNRMKFHIKLSKEEADGFVEFTKQLKPEQMNDLEWYRAIFYKGLEKIQEDIMEGMKKYMDEHQDDIDTSAVEMMQDASATPEVIE